MRSQLLICLENFHGIVIFATNLVTNYDPAFETRIRHIHFPMPDVKAREAIWRKHMPPSLPVDETLDHAALAAAEAEFCGRDIKNAVINAALHAAREGQTCLCQDNILLSIRKIVGAREELRTKYEPASENLTDSIRQAVHEDDESMVNREELPEMVG